MRKVMFKKKNSEEFVEGVLHLWGNALDNGEVGCVTYSVALVEDLEGQIHSVLPENIKYKENFEERQKEINLKNFRN